MTDILIVEDNKELADLLCDFLRAENYTVSVAQTGEKALSLYEKYGVDAVLSAHLHTYRRRVPLRNFAPAEDGITYILTGVAGNVRYPKLWGYFAWDAARAPQPETANYMTMEVDNNKLVFKAFLPDGKQFDGVEIKK